MEENNQVIVLRDMIRKKYHGTHLSSLKLTTKIITTTTKGNINLYDEPQ